jgi:hypothetical protein
VSTSTGRRFADGVVERAATLVGLTGIAIAQPLLDLLGRNPEFFVAGRYTREQIIELGLIVTLAPALVVALVAIVTTLIDRRLGRGVFVVLLAVLGALLGNVIARGLDSDATAVAILASVLGAAVALFLGRVRAGRLLLQYLAVGNVLFLVGFLVISPASRLLSNDSVALGGVTVPDPPGPVVVIVLDELPISSLLTVDGTINAERYPSFARLADQSTWFRNASSRHALTHFAVPALLAGRIPVAGELPTYADHPRNLLSLLGTTMPVDRYEVVTDLCPPDSCAPLPAQPLSQALHDSSVVYLHRALPASLRSDLPAIDHAWGGFGDELGGAVANADAEEDGGGGDEGADPFLRWKSMDAGERSAPGQAAILVERGQAITSEPALHVIHVALPHFPWTLTPSGSQLMEYPERITDQADPAYEWSGRQQYQLHSMQLGAADVALGRVMDHLESTGVWEATTFVVVSDHGISLLNPDFGRERTPNNEQELFRTAMFVKAAGQQKGEVRDEPAQSIDLLPTLVDLLNIDTQWDFDGHSLLDGSEPEIEPLVGREVDPLFDIVRAHAAEFPAGNDWTALAAVGTHADLVGRPLESLSVGRSSAFAWVPDHEDSFADLPTPEGRTPQLLTGLVASPDDARPPELVVVVNGTVAGVAGGYLPVNGAWRFTAFLGPYLRDGANQIDAYEVVDGPQGPELRSVG